MTLDGSTFNVAIIIKTHFKQKKILQKENPTFL